MSKITPIIIQINFSLILFTTPEIPDLLDIFLLSLIQQCVYNICLSYKNPHDQHAHMS